jgi:succinyl-diaminopimelate desuccinylase
MSGELTLNMGTLRLQAGVLKLVINIRYPVFFNEAMIRSQIEEVFNGFRVESFHHQKPLYVSPESELVKMCREVYKEVTGNDEEPIAIGGGTYARAVPNAVAFGALLPGNVELAHQPNERISIEDVLLVARIYAQLFLRFLQT